MPHKINKMKKIILMNIIPLLFVSSKLAGGNIFLEEYNLVIIEMKIDTPPPKVPIRYVEPDLNPELPAGYVDPNLNQELPAGYAEPNLNPELPENQVQNQELPAGNINSVADLQRSALLAIIGNRESNQKSRDRRINTHGEITSEEGRALQINYTIHDRVKLSDARWFKGLIKDEWIQNGVGFNMSYRRLMTGHLLESLPNRPSYVASCINLVALIDNVKITKEEIASRAGYWAQFDMTKLGQATHHVEVFESFKLQHLEMTLDVHSIFDLMFLMDQYGPFIIVPKNGFNSLFINEIDYDITANVVLNANRSTTHEDPFKVFYHNPDKPEAQVIKRDGGYDKSLIGFADILAVIDPGRKHKTNIAILDRNMAKHIPTHTATKRDLPNLEVYIVYNDNFDLHHGENKKVEFLKEVEVHENR